jgi:hypothetical protein
MSEVEYNAANPEHVAQAKREAVDIRERELEDVRFVMSSKEGRRFFDRYQRLCHVHETSFTGNNSTFFNEGERNIGVRMLADVNEACPELYIELLKEKLEIIKRNEKIKKK